jgi:uncharacterized protein (TIGR03790 family)
MISEENVLILYLNGDDDSYAFAEAYAELHSLEAEQLFPVTSSNDEFLSNYNTYKTQIIDPLKTYINTLSRDIYAIVLGYNVPAGFYDGDDIISGTSVISRMYHSYNKKENNKNYQRQISSSLTESDFNYSLICTRIDLDTLDNAIQILDNTDIALRQRQTTGIFYIDPYSDVIGDNANLYTDDILLFKNNLLNKLNLESFSTQFIDEYIDSLVPSLSDDSFFWGWFTDRGSESYFRETSSIRAFFYNADFDGAFTMKSLTDRNWCPLALKKGYVATAGALSNPGIDGFLRPYPFFYALLNGMTLGEAYLVSMPYFNWSLDLFGDPLLKFTFPERSINENLEKSSEDLWLKALRNIEESIALYYAKKNRAFDIVKNIAESEDIIETYDLITPAYKYYKGLNDEHIKSIFGNISENILRFATFKFSYLLQERPVKLSKFLVDSLSDSTLIKDENISQSGYWFIDYVLQDETDQYENYHFDLEIYSDREMLDLLFAIDSDSIQEGWQYEYISNTFVDINSTGVSSGYIGKRIKYFSTEDTKINFGDVFYYKIRQKNISNNFNWTTGYGVSFL